ncbi:heparan-alpha-glucosaminide N-acetyltransferase domain-containing protein [Ammonicoccus fulvus]|uniref:Heparan-alpha-glucosaminide N-acetyltransferase domain-containing protein n=1 Tax=Ammonicoccus fulvus TaxID=3138240 RepID=A0ABZ3FRF5_9ACTN
MAYAAPNPPDSTPVAAPTLSPVSPNAAEIPHACEPETLATGPSPADRARLLGIDVARALAVLGMVAVHLVPDASGDGMSPAFIISSGKSAALFAVLAGVGIALSTGREHRPRGRRWLGSLAAVTVRAVLIALVGLALGLVVSSERADVILVAYAAMFLLALPLLRLPPWALAILATALAIGMPILSHSLRRDLPLATLANPSFVTLARDPAGTMLEVF